MNLDDLDAAFREKMLAGTTRLRGARGEIIYAPGDRADAVYFVLAGRVKLVRTNAGGAESIVGIRDRGDILGELTWMGAPRTRTTSAIVLDPAELARLDAGDFERRLARDATLAATFARGVARRLASAQLELTELAGKSVPGRLVDALGRLAHDHGIEGDDGSVRIGLNLTHQELADLIGTSRETLTKELGVLADIGLVRIAHRTVTLVQPRAFPRAARRT